MGVCVRWVHNWVQGALRFLVLFRQSVLGVVWRVCMDIMVGIADGFLRTQCIFHRVIYNLDISLGKCQQTILDKTLPFSQSL